MKRKGLCLLTLAAALALQGPAFAEQWVESDKGLIGMPETRTDGNFHFRNPGYSIVTGELLEIGEDTVTLGVTDWDYNSSVERLLFEKNDLPAEISVGDRVQVFYKGGIIDYPAIDIEKPLITFFFWPADAERTLQQKTDFLRRLGVINGFADGDYRLDQPITRAEMATMMMNYLGFQDTEDWWPAPFTDMEGHWARNIVARAYVAGVVHGVSETLFLPDTEVSVQDAAVMLLAGNADLAQEIEALGGYPEGYLACAKRYGLLDAAAVGTEPAARGRVVEMLFATYDLGQAYRPVGAAKPVIYLYPEEPMEVDVTLELEGELTFTYPAYDGGWHVTARPDGTLVSGGREYDYLFWEGETTRFQPDLSEGFLVKREDTVAFLETNLEKLGLTTEEANEFIVYWAPILMENAYNKITFVEEAYTEAVRLRVTPAPDTLLRVFMVYEKADADTAVTPQTLRTTARNGFTVVEWGGAEWPSAAE